MRGLVAVLDAAAALREAAGIRSLRLPHLAMAAELAGADAVRLGANEALRPVGEAEMHDVRRVARELELRTAPAPSLLKLALEVRPDRVVLAGEPPPAGLLDAPPLDPEALRGPVPPALRALREAGIPARVRIAPDPEAVKAARAADATAVEFTTVAIVDLPEPERSAAWERLSDVARLAAKLHMEVAAGGRLDGRALRALVVAAPVVRSAVVGRELVSRALLVGVERAVRDLRVELG
jgi:pyridoxine 5-phosphate synthase